MPRPLRWIPEGGALVEVTCRTIHGRYLLRPSHNLNEIIVGILARAKAAFDMKICALIFLSSHYHILLRVRDAKQLAGFMNYLNSNLAREAGRLAQWREKFWSRRYRSIVISEEEGAQIGRMKYVISNGTKEDLVGRPSDWPGVHCLGYFLEGKPLEGYWFDRTQEYAARQRREDFDRLRYATAETLTLDPLPCWEGLSAEQIRFRVAQLVSEVELEAASALDDGAPLGPEAILSQDPHRHPQHSKKSPAPRVHAFSQEVRRALYNAYSEFLGKFRDAAEKLRSGDLSARFPPGSFPPGLPFVSSYG